MSNTRQLTEQLQAQLKQVRDIAAAAEEADRDFTDDERAQVTAGMEKAKDIKAQIDRAKGDDEMRKAIAELGEGYDINDDAQQRRTPSGLIVPGKKSVGQHIVEHEEYRNLLATVPGGSFSKDHRVQSRPIGFKDLITGGSDTSGGAFVQPDNIGLQTGMDLFQRPLRLRDLVTSGTTTSDTIEYVRITGITNNAATVPEATTAAGGTADTTTGEVSLPAGSGVKPESGLATAKVTTPVRTIAHWIPLTKRALSDAAQIRTLVDGFLRYGLEEELEDQMIAGDGTGENFEGLANVSGVQVGAWDAGGTGEDMQLLRTLRKAKTLVRTVGRSMANGYVLNPADLERVDLAVDGNGGFYFGGPAAAGGAPPLWGLPVVESEAVPAGVGYVGDWRKAVLWDREQASITFTDSHADFFIRNLVAILAEMRAAFGVIQPSAFVRIDLTAA